MKTTHEVTCPICDDPFTLEIDPEEGTEQETKCDNCTADLDVTYDPATGSVTVSEPEECCEICAKPIDDCECFDEEDDEDDE